MAASALNALRGKHLRALEQLDTALRELEQARAACVDQRGAERARKEWAAKLAASVRESEALREELGEKAALAEKEKAIKALLIEAASRDAALSKKWEDQCGVLAQRIASQKSAFVQASDELNALRNELSGVQQRHQREMAALTEASARHAAGLEMWRERAERAEGSHAAGSSTAEKLQADVRRLTAELSRVRREKQNDRDRTLAAEEAERADKAKWLKEQERMLESLRRENDDMRAEVMGLRKAGSVDGLALRRARETIKQLEGSVDQEHQRAIFLEKSLEAAKAEWTKLANENSALKARLAQLEQIAQGGSKFAKFVSLKEENQKLANQHARLRKAHIKLRKGVKARSGPRSFGAPIQPKRPETTHR
jgi:hypothetical protein